MITVDKITVSDQFGLDRLFVSFSIVNTTEDIANYRFDLYRSLNSENDFEAVAYDLKVFSYQDYSVNLYNRGLHYYYKVLVTELATGDSNWSGSFGSYLVNQPDNYAQAIMTIEAKYLTNVIANESMDLYKRRQSGQICSCVDEIRKRANPSCPICFGTQLVGGYYPAEKILVNFTNVAQRQHRMESYGDFDDTSPIQLWTKPYPLIANEDVLVDLHGDAHIVTNWVPSYKTHFLIRQTVSVSRIPRSSAFYNILRTGGEI